MIGGAAALICCALLVSDAMLAQRSARNALDTAANVERPALRPEPGALTAPRVPELTVRRGDAIGALSIPRLQLSAVVLHGSDAQTLRRGPGHLENTAYPGDSGNMVIAGHRDSFFWPLRDIQRGDDIFLDTPEGRFQYQVTWLRVVSPKDLSVLAPTSQPELTLITCYPFWVFGDAPDRLVVRAAAVEGRSGESPMQVTSGFGELSAGEPVENDELLVQQAVERFRTAYNTRSATHSADGSNQPLRFGRCAVAVNDDRATAVCETVAPSSSDPEQHDRTFTLERSDDGWAIRSIVLN
jgi:sortase A